MTRLNNSFEGGTTGAIITAANSGGTSGDAFSAPYDAGSAPTFSTTNPAHGTKSMSSPLGTGYAYVEYDFTAATVVAIRAYLTVDAVSTIDDRVIRFFTGTTESTGLRINGAGKLRAYDAATTLWTGTSNLATNTVLRLELYVVCGTGNATVQGAYYLGDSTTPVESFNISTATTTAASFTSVRIGKSLGSAVSANHWWDDIALETAATGLLGPYAAPTGSTVKYASITAATGWTPSATTILADLSDGNIGTYAETGDNPSSLLIDGILNPVAAPAGDFVVQVPVSKSGATTGSIVGKLYDSATLRATSASVPVPNGATTVNITFLAASITGVTSWGTGVRLTLAGSAS